MSVALGLAVGCAPAGSSAPATPEEAAQAEQLKQLPTEEVAALEKALSDKVLKIKASYANMKIEVDRTQNEHLRSGLNEMKADYEREVLDWQRFRRLQGKSDAVPSEFKLE